MQINAEFFVILLAFFAPLVALISETFILPSKLKKYKNQDTSLFERQFKDVSRIAFFYLLFVSFLMRLVDYFYPIIIGHPITDLVLIIWMLVIIFLVLYRAERAERNGKFLIEPKSDWELYLIISFVVSLFFLFLNLSFVHNSEAIFDQSISFIMLISNAVLLGIFYKINKDRLSQNI